MTTLTNEHGAPHFTWRLQGHGSQSSLKSFHHSPKTITWMEARTELGSAIDDENVNGLGDLSVASKSIQGHLISFFRLKSVEMILGSVIFVNLCFMVMETDHDAKDEISPRWVTVANSVLIVFYCIELCLRLYAFRLAFFNSYVNLFDMAVVLVDSFFVVFEMSTDGTNFPNLSMLRMFRLLRLGRTLRVLIMFPELTRMVNSLMAACKKVFWAGLLLLFTLFVWSILCVQIIHPLNKQIADSGYYAGSCSRCPHAYGSVFQACLTIIQNLIAGDSWGSVNLVVIEEYPVTVLFFAAMLLNIGLIMLNLITAMIVDGAQDARHQEDHTLAHLKEQEFVDATEKLRRLCENMDEDGNGVLTCEELRQGFESNEEFRITMKAIDIRLEDIDVLFGILDIDGSGDVNYVEFVKQMHKLRCDDMHTIVVFIKHYVTEVHKKVTDQLHLLRMDVFKDLQAHIEGLSGELKAMTEKHSIDAADDAASHNTYGSIPGNLQVQTGSSEPVLAQILNHMTYGLADQHHQLNALRDHLHINDNSMPPGRIRRV